MRTKEIIKNNKHRPWKIPNKKWKYYQEWNNAIFLHWKVDYNELKKFVPNELEIDLVDQSPWVSLVAFTMEKIRPRNLPAISTISNFDEINIRTYVRYKGKAGVYFLNIEAGKRISSYLAKKISELPYSYSKMKRSKGQFISKNNKLNDIFNAEYTIGDKIRKKDENDLWLTERYALFQNSKSYINEYDIHHIEWPVYEVNLKNTSIKYPKFSNLLTNSPDKRHYSTGVQVIAWGGRKHKTKIIKQ